MRRAFGPALVLLLVGSAGCIGDDPADDGRQGYQDVSDPIPTDAGHDHADPAAHRFARAMSVTAHDDLQGFGASEEEVVGAHAAATAGDLLAVAVRGPQQQGFHLYDTSGSGLRHLAFYDARIVVNGDRTIAFSDDGQTVFLGHEGGDEPGVAAVDVSDPADPVQAGFFADPTGFGPHTLSAGAHDGTQYVFLLNLGVTMLTYEDGAFQVAGRYVTSDDLGLLGALSSSSGPDTYAVRTLYGHDMTFWVDPDTDLPYLAVAYAYDGVKLLDVSDMAAPVPVMRWRPPTDTGHNHYVHSTGMTKTGDGRVILVVGSETFEEENQGIASPLWILDVTAATSDPAVTAPEHLSTWSNPAGAPAGNLQRSVHFFRIQDDLLYVSHYHGGVWVLDLADPTGEPPATVGYITPVSEHPIPVPEDCCIGFPLQAVPMVFDVAVSGNGGIYAADLIQGVFRLRLER